MTEKSYKLRLVRTKEEAMELEDAKTCQNRIICRTRFENFFFFLYSL